MSSAKDIELVIISIEKYNITHKLHILSTDIKTVDDLYLLAITKNWIESAKMFYFINNGELLTGNTDVKTLTKSIMLLICNNVKEYKLSSMINPHQSLIQDLSNIIMQPHVTGIDAIIPFLNNNIVPLGSNIDEIHNAVPILPFHPNISIPASLTNSITASMTLNTIPDGPNVTSGSHLMRESTSTINDMLNSTNVVIDQNDDFPLNSVPTSSPDSVPTSSPDSVPISSPDSVPISSPDSVPTSSPDSGDIITEQSPETIDSLEINDDDTNVESANVVVTQSSNINQSGNHPSVENNLSNIHHQYIEQFNDMKSMGFMDDNKILMSLYICDGDCSSAINYYLSLQDDL